MKRNFVQRCKGFTLVELLVVIAIMGILMTMGAGVLRDGGKGRGIDSGLDMLENLVREARATAQGNGTVTFAASDVPEINLTVNLLIIDSGVGA